LFDPNLGPLSAESYKEEVDCLKTSGLLRNRWTPLLGQPGTCPKQVMRQNEAQQSTRACLIPIHARKPSAEPCKEGVDSLKTGGLLRNEWVPSLQGSALGSRARIGIKRTLARCSDPFRHVGCLGQVACKSGKRVHPFRSSPLVFKQSTPSLHGSALGLRPQIGIKHAPANC
jgi:hypothetical protein